MVISEVTTQLTNLGRFVIAFAQVEALLRQTVGQIGGVSDTFYKVVLSGMRAEDAISYLKKLLKERDIDEQMDVDYTDIFGHLNPIKDARNLILHSGISMYGLGFAATNRSRVLDPDDAVVIPVSSVILQEMTDDLIKMTAMLANNLLKLGGPPLLLADDPAGQSAWRYIPPPQGGSQKRKDRSGQPKGKKR